MKEGILLVNLGSPQAPSAAAIRSFLKVFLSDPRVIQRQGPLWKLLLNGVILRKRPKRLVPSYRKIWHPSGYSPLGYYTEQLAENIQEQYQFSGREVSVRYAMRYGTPSISAALQNFRIEGVEKLIVLPMFPQYSRTTTESVFDCIHPWRKVFREVQLISDYHCNPGYIAAIVSQIRHFQHRYGKPQYLLFSYHGLPQRYVDQGDPYAEQCYETTRLVARQLGLADDTFQTVFQSRFGPAKWLRPYTDETLAALPKQGITNVHIIAPGFACDCLETLEELALGNREIFRKAGGSHYQFIPCLNADKAALSTYMSVLAGY